MKHAEAFHVSNDPDDELTAELHLVSALELMPIVIVPETATLDELRAILTEQRVPAIAVVDSDQTLTGIVTRTDVLRAVHEVGATAHSLMSMYIVAVPMDATIECAAALMAVEGVGQIVVTSRDGELAGFISAFDIARHVAARAGYIAA